MIRDTLLIIDDSELDLAILNEIFKNLFEVECISDPRKGLTFLHQNKDRVCAILLDICLERRGEGFTVLHQFQANPDTSDLPVILITTDASEKDVRASVERGAVDFLVKPVNPHTVQERVCSVVRSAWPANSTVLDCRPEPEVQPASEKTEKVNHSYGKMDLEEAKGFCQLWTSKLESFCRLRKGLKMQAYEQLGAITTLLAQRYAEAFPDSGLSSEDAALIGMASAFCDIGLLGIPDRIIEAGEDQEGEDSQIYYQHTCLGHELFAREEQDNPLFGYAAEIALWHHKNADGSGYPLDSDGSAIPLSAQLARMAMRIQYYLHYYRGYADGVDRMLRTLKSEVGIIITPQVYRVAEMEKQALQQLLPTS